MNALTDKGKKTMLAIGSYHPEPHQELQKQPEWLSQPLKLGINVAFSVSAVEQCCPFGKLLKNNWLEVLLNLDTPYNTAWLF